MTQNQQYNYRNYSRHIQKLQEIQFEVEARRRKKELGEKIVPKVNHQAISLLNKKQMDLQFTVHANKQRAFAFKESQKLSEINRDNIKILNKLVEISKGKQSKYGQQGKKRSSTNTTFYHSQYKSQLNGGVSLFEQSNMMQPSIGFPPATTNHSIQYSISPSPKRVMSGGSESPSQRTNYQSLINQGGNTSLYTAGPSKITSPSASGANGMDLTLHFFARKKESERIDLENRKIKKHIDGQKPVLSFRKMEKDFKHHMKVRSQLGKANGLMPIESFKRKREEIVRNYLPPLSTESPSGRGKETPTSNQNMFSYRSATKNQYIDLFPVTSMMSPLHQNFDLMHYDDPKLQLFMQEQQRKVQKKVIDQKISTLEKDDFQGKQAPLPTMNSQNSLKNQLLARPEVPKRPSIRVKEQIEESPKNKQISPSQMNQRLLQAKRVSNKVNKDIAPAQRIEMNLSSVQKQNTFISENQREKILADDEGAMAVPNLNDGQEKSSGVKINFAPQSSLGMTLSKDSQGSINKNAALNLGSLAPISEDNSVKTRAQEIKGNIQLSDNRQAQSQMSRKEEGSSQYADEQYEQDYE